MLRAASLLIFALLQAAELRAEDEVNEFWRKSGEEAIEAFVAADESNEQGDDAEGGGDEEGDEEEGEGDGEEGDGEEGGDEDVPALTEQQVSNLFEKMGEASRQAGVISTRGIHLDEAKAFMIKMETSEAEAQVLEIAKDALSEGNLPLEKVVQLYGDGGDSEGWPQKAKAADVDGDGLLSKEELVSLHMPQLNKDVLALFVHDMLSEMDLDHDGKVSLDEYEKDQGGDEQFKEHFAVFDKDNDGFLAGSELEDLDTGKLHDERAIAHMVQIADTDQDGYVTSHEFLDVSQKIREEYEESQYSALAHDQLLRWSGHLEL